MVTLIGFSKLYFPLLGIQRKNNEITKHNNLNADLRQELPTQAKTFSGKVSCKDKCK